MRLLLILLALALTGCASPIYRAGDTAVTRVSTTDHPRPSVILIHGCGGTQPHEHWMGILDQQGFNTVLIDYISYRGFTTICDKNAPISITAVASDVDQIIAWVRTQKWHKGRVSAMGFSFGGSITNTFTDPKNLEAKGIIAGNIRRLDRIVSVYPQCGIGALAEQTLTPTQVHFGLSDYWTHHSYCMVDRLDKSNYDLIYYPNAYHGFDMPGVSLLVNGHHRVEFNQQAFDLMKVRLVEFLR